MIILILSILGIAVVGGLYMNSRISKTSPAQPAVPVTSGGDVAQKAIKNDKDVKEATKDSTKKKDDTKDEKKENYNEEDEDKPDEDDDE